MQPQKRPDSDRYPESLEKRLRALPPLPVPCDLEARLLAAIPAEKRSVMPHPVRASYRHRVVWAGAAIAFATACLLIVLLRPEPGDKNTVRHLAVSPETSGADFQTVPHRPGSSLNITPWLESRRGLEGSDRPTFTWPIREKFPLMASTSIPIDLLE